MHRGELFVVDVGERLRAVHVLHAGFVGDDLLLLCEVLPQEREHLTRGGLNHFQ